MQTLRKLPITAPNIAAIVTETSPTAETAKTAENNPEEILCALCVLCGKTWDFFGDSVIVEDRAVPVQRAAETAASSETGERAHPASARTVCRSDRSVRRGIHASE